MEVQMSNDTHHPIVKSVGIIVSVMSLVVSLVLSWGHFYSEQKINTKEIAMLQTDKRELSKVVFTLNSNQSTLIEAVSNQAHQTNDLKHDFKELLKVLGQNQATLTKILTKVE